MANAKSPSPRVTRADRSPSTTHHSSHEISPHPPRSSKRYPPLRMAAPPNDASNPPPSPSLRHAHPVLSSRPSQRKSSKGSIGSNRPPTPVSRSSAKDFHSGAQLTTQSTLLQEKLQQERRHDIQRSLTRLADEMGVTNDSKTGPATPTQCAATDGRRTDLTGDVRDGKDNGFSLKEMGQTMSTLHKQNFDLKLELFHRRARQAALEEKIEVLEANCVDAEQANSRLMQDLENRDKAVEEAVQIIVALEARIELMLREREMTEQVEVNKALLAELDSSPSDTLVNHGATAESPDHPASNDKHTVTRMPSFLSERTEDTENLRNVYLDTKNSYLSLTKVDSREGNTGFVSPSLSILSESSFVSIYGPRKTNDSPSPPDVSNTIQGRLISSGQRSASLPIKNYIASKTQRGERSGSRDGAQFAIQQGGAQPPTQRLEKLDAIPKATLQALFSVNDIERSTTVRPNKPQVLPKVRRDSEKPVRKLVTSDSSGNHPGLPPTPDTMTSSINTSQGHIFDASPPRNLAAKDSTHYPVISRLKLDQTDELEPGHWRFRSPDVAQPPSITAFTGRQGASGASPHYENRLTAMRRPRSADETTISRHKNDWDSCSDGDDLCSEASSFDYWMKEGLGPSRGGIAKGQKTTFSSQSGSSRNPPDLFAFPSNGKGWQSKEMFGALDGNGYLGVSCPLSPALNALGDSLLAPENSLYGSGLASTISPRPQGAATAPPPAPYRRSSLKARTTAPGTPSTERAPVSHGSKRSVSGHALGSSNLNGWPMTSNTRSKSPTPLVRPQTQHPDLSAPKRHYPPHANQPQATPRPRSRGITSLFRRSLGSTTPQPSASVPASQSPFEPPPGTRKDASPSTVGFPTWERRNDLMEDGPSATPPPILRNRGTMEGSSDYCEDEEEQGGTVADFSQVARGRGTGSLGSGLGSGLSKLMAAREGGATLTPARNNANDQEHDTTTQPSQGYGRRWFNLSRVTNHHKNSFGGA